MRAALLVVSTSLVLAACVSAESYCPDSWLKFGNQCYWKSNLSAPWSSVSSKCDLQSPGSRPSSVHTLYQNTALVSLLDGHQAWVGLSRVNSTAFNWSDNTPVDYTFWANDQPSDAGDCVVINADNVTGQWATSDCTKKRPFICQREAGRCPEGWTLYSGRCFLYNKTLIYEDEQYNACRSIRLESAPVSIHEKDTSEFLRTLIDNDFPVWIGLRRTGPGTFMLGTRVGQWHWLDGSPVVFTYWYLYPRQDDLYAVMYKEDDGTWHSLGDSDDIAGFICQITLTS